MGNNARVELEVNDILCRKEEEPRILKPFARVELSPTIQRKLFYKIDRALNERNYKYLFFCEVD